MTEFASGILVHVLALSPSSSKNTVLPSQTFISSMGFSPRSPLLGWAASITLKYIHNYLEDLTHTRLIYETNIDGAVQNTGLKHACTCATVLAVLELARRTLLLIDNFLD